MRQSVSIPADMAEEVQRHIAYQGSSFSAYIQELIACDLKNSDPVPETTNRQSLVRLAETFHPTAAGEIQKWADSTEGLQQPFFIYRMLCALHDAITNNRSSLSLDLSEK